MCGEQAVCLTSWCRMSGSPPRVRGTGLNRGILQIVNRITPACAGNSRQKTARRRSGWDHPRVCGEQSVQSLSPWASWGSPPRVRGTGGPYQANRPYFGITPACAGNRKANNAEAKLNEDHPRVCGEQTISHPLTM